MRCRRSARVAVSLLWVTVCLVGLLLGPRPLHAEAPDFRPGATLTAAVPAGFVLDAVSSGADRSVYTRPEGGWITLFELFNSGEGFRTGVLDGTLTSLKRIGFAETARRAATFAGHPGVLVEAERAGPPGVRAWIAVFPGDDRSYLVSILMPGPAEDARAVAAPFLASIAVRPPIDLVAARAGLRFGFTDLPGLTLVAVAEGTAVLSAPQRIVRMVLSRKPAGWAGADETPAMLARRTIDAELPGQANVSIEPAGSKRVAGIDGAEFRAGVGGTRGAPAIRTVIWLAPMPQGGLLQMICYAQPDAFDGAMPLFEKVRDSVTLR